MPVNVTMLICRLCTDPGVFAVAEAFVDPLFIWPVVGGAALFVVVLLFWLRDVRHVRRLQDVGARLRRSEMRFREFFKQLPEPVYIENEAGVVLDVNPQACELQGMTREELVGSNVLDLVPEGQREAVKAAFPKWFSGEMSRYEGQVQRSDGQVVYVELVGSTMEVDGQPALLLQVRDISERKRSEAALRKSEARYRSLIEVQNSLVVRLSTEGRFTFVNEAVCRFLGRHRGELVGQPFQPIVSSENIPLVKQVLAQLIGGEETVIIEDVRTLTTSGPAWVNWEATAIVDDHGRVTEVQAVGRDVTEYRRVLRVLQESEKRLRFLFEEIPHIAVQGYDDQRKVIFWNRASERLYGYSREEALGRNIEDLVVAPEQQAAAVAEMSRWIESGESIPSGEKLKCRAGGEQVMVHTTRLATRNIRGGREMYVVDVDLSELQRANSALVEAKEEAERASRAKSEFLANMSHEIRTPMNGVMGMTRLLLDSDLTEEQRDLAQTSMDSMKELLSIIDELLDISRIEAGELRLQMDPFSPREMVEKVVALFEEWAVHKGVALSVVVHPGVPEQMMGDAGRIRQVLINLVGNALKFTEEGHIQVRMQAEPADIGWRLKVDVKDTGIGMDKALLERVFDKFTQADTSLSRRYGGVGLGLAISKQLVDLMGGSISVFSEIGQGTTFLFDIVLSAMENPDAVPPPSSPPPPDDQDVSLSADVLVVEDNLVNQKVAAALLKKQGCRVTVASNGEEALRVLDGGQHFDLILMDCQMPVMDGFEATQAIRDMDGEIADVPIIALTAHALKGDREKCLGGGMTDYLSKPISKGKLIQILQTYCGLDASESKGPRVGA